MFLEKKSYLIVFSFKFNEIKFLLMNWLIQEKIFNYFYNKFRPLNRMHFIECGVNSSLHNSGCCRRSVAPWITVLSQRWFTNLLLCDIPRNKAPRTGSGYIWRTYKLCTFFVCEKNTDGSGVGLISLASAYGDSGVTKHFLCPNLVFQPIWGLGDLGSFQLPLSNSSPEGAWNLGVCI